MAGQLSEVQVEITPLHQIVRIVMVDVDGGSTEFRFSNWKEDPQLSGSLFSFSPPPGVESVEGAELAP
jgi:outer membrane lipoprotein-sorting protein